MFQLSRVFVRGNDGSVIRVDSLKAACLFEKKVVMVGEQDGHVSMMTKMMMVISDRQKRTERGTFIVEGWF